MRGFSIESAVADYKDGLSTFDIADKYDTNQPTIYGLLKAAGVKFRSYSESVKNSYDRGKGKGTLHTQNGETHNVAEWCRVLGRSEGTVRNRLAHKWSVFEALNTAPGAERDQSLAG